MRRLLALMALAALAAAAPSFAGGVSGRTLSRAYTGIGGVQGVISGTITAQGGGYGFVSVPTTRNERTVSIKVTDQDGQPVAFAVSQGNPKSASDQVQIGEWCAATPHAIRLPRAGQPLIVSTEVGVCGTTPSAPTSGTVSMTLR